MSAIMITWSTTVLTPKLLHEVKIEMSNRGSKADTRSDDEKHDRRSELVPGSIDREGDRSKIQGLMVQLLVSVNMELMVRSDTVERSTFRLYTYTGAAPGKLVVVEVVENPAQFVSGILSTTSTTSIL